MVLKKILLVGKALQVAVVLGDGRTLVDVPLLDLVVHLDSDRD